MQIKRKNHTAVELLFRNKIVFFLSLVFGCNFSLYFSNCVNITSMPLDSKRFLALTVLLGLASTVLYFFVLFWAKKQLVTISRKVFLQLLLVSFTLGFILFFTTTSQWLNKNSYVKLLLPMHRFEISSLPEDTPDSIFLTWFSTSFGNLPFNVLNYHSKDSFSWQGRTGEELTLILGSRGDGKIIFSWDGNIEIVDMNSEPGKEYVVMRTLPVPWYASRMSTFVIGGIFFATIVFIILIPVFQKQAEILLTLRKRLAAKSFVKNYEWFIILGLTFFSLLLRSFNLDALPPHLEEYNHLNAAKDILEGVPLEMVYQRSLYVVTLPVKFFFSVFGVRLWVARLPGILINSFAILPLYFLARKISRPVAVLSGLLYATSPWVIALSRSVREYAYYPFLFYLIVLGLIQLLENFPKKGVFSDWKFLLTPKILVPIIFLASPLFFVLFIDPFSTFKVIFLAYFILVLFLIKRFDLKNSTNILTFVLISVVSVAGLYIFAQRTSLVDLKTFFQTINPAHPLMNFKNGNATILLSQFFFNPPVQWYYGRLLLFPILSLIISVFLSFSFKEKKLSLLFLTVLYIFSVISFVLLFNFDYAPRFFLHMQLWYIILLGTGFYALYQVGNILIKKTHFRVLLIIIVVLTTFNFQQILLPVSDEYSVITYSAHIGFEELNAYLQEHVSAKDVLVSKYYGRYAKFAEVPKYKEIYDESFSEDAILNNDSGWIVVEDTRYWFYEGTLPQKKFQLGCIDIQYVGEFEDNSGLSNFVWHWDKTP